ncbi:hypothetical protein CsSME_00023724 [Camellia sinensis var. sinensis]
MAKGNVRRCSSGDGIPVTSNTDNAQRRIIVLEAELKAKDFVIAKLEDQVAKFKKAIEQQASTLFVGFNDCLKLKEGEIAQLANVISDLKKKISRLEVQIEAKVGCTVRGSPHADVRGDDSDSFAFADEKNKEKVIHDVTQNAVGQFSFGSEAMGVVDVVGGANVVAKKCANGDVDVPDLQPVGGLSDEVRIETSLQNSFVRNIKGKMRREKKLPEFEYRMLRGRLRKVDSNDGQRVVGDDAPNCDIMLCDDVVNVDGIGKHEKKRSGFGLNNHLSVWKLVNETVKCKLSNAYNRDGDE